MAVNVSAGSGVIALGNSITLSGNAADANNGYVYRLGGHVKGPVTNLAISGQGLKSAVSQAYANLPYGNRPQLLTIDAPLNDIRRSGESALPSIKPALTAILAAAFSGQWRSPNSPNDITRTGSWSALGNSYGGRSFFSGFSGLCPMYASAAGAAVSFWFTGPIVCVHAYIAEAATTFKNLDIEIDGVPRDDFTVVGKVRPGDIATGAAMLFSGLGAGPHVIKVISQSASPYTIIDGFSVPAVGANAGVIVGAVPNIRDWSAGGMIGTIDDAAAANEIQKSVVCEWSALGFPVIFADVNKYISGIRDNGPDGIHYSDTGHGNYAIAYIDAVRLVP